MPARTPTTNRNGNGNGRRRTTKRRPRRIRTKAAMEIVHKAHRHDHEDCAICLEPIRCHQVMSVTPCKHVFHDRCMLNLLYATGSRTKCPLCRAPVSKKSINVVLTDLVIDLTDD